MIYDTIENFIKYAPQIIPGSSILMPFLEAVNSGTFEEIKSMDPGGLDLRFGEYETKSADEIPFESHKLFWDLQIVMEGKELVGYAPLETLSGASEYDPDSDISFYSGSGQMFRLEKGMMMLLSPADGHQPGVISGELPSLVRKIVIKLPW
ncbi:MAG: YhcH/YjgK/YiaL family protein [Synergistaceae bacterium]|nr:YhcH/YjgK/YiaL family protein [Synergistaceae bacterium]